MASRTSAVKGDVHSSGAPGAATKMKSKKGKKDSSSAAAITESSNSSSIGKHRTNVEAYSLTVIAYGTAYDVPVTCSTRIGSVLREVAELAIPLAKAKELGMVNAGLFYRSTPLEIHSAVGDLPKGAILHFHTSADLALSDRGSTTISMGTPMGSLRSIYGNGIVQPLRLLQGSAYSMNAVSPNATLNSELHSKSTSTSPAGVSDKSSSSSPAVERQMYVSAHGESVPLQQFMSSPAILFPVSAAPSTSTTSLSAVRQRHSFSGGVSPSGGGRAGVPAFGLEDPPFCVPTPRTQMLYLSTSPGGAASPYIVQPFSVAGHQTLSPVNSAHGMSLLSPPLSPLPPPPGGAVAEAAANASTVVAEICPAHAKKLKRDAEKATISNEFYVVVYVRLPETDGSLSNVGINPPAVHSHTDSDGSVLRRLRMNRLFPIGALRDLFVVPSSMRILMDGVLVEDEAKSAREFKVQPRAVFSFATHSEATSDAHLAERQRARLHPHLHPSHCPAPLAPVKSLEPMKEADNLAVTPNNPPGGGVPKKSKLPPLIATPPSESTAAAATPTSASADVIAPGQLKPQHQRPSPAVDQGHAARLTPLTSAEAVEGGRRSPTTAAKVGTRQDREGRATSVTPGPEQPKFPSEGDASIQPVGSPSFTRCQRARRGASPPIVTVEEPMGEHPEEGSITNIFSESLRETDSTSPDPATFANGTRSPTSILVQSMRAARHNGKHMDQSATLTSPTPSPVPEAEVVAADPQKYTVVSSTNAGLLRITIRDPLNPTQYNCNVPVERGCPVGMLRTWLMEEVMEKLTKMKDKISIPPLLNNLEYAVFCGNVRVMNDMEVSFENATAGKNDCVFSVQKLHEEM